MQLSRRYLVALVSAFVVIAARPVLADDKVDFTTTWFQEQRRGGKGGLTVVHPQFDVGVDIGKHASFGMGYSADVVTGATASVFRVDAISTATSFTDTRHEARMTVGITGRRSTFGMSVSAGTERDYSSITVSTSGNIDLPGKNTKIALAYTHNFDEVCDKDNAQATPFDRRALDGSDPCEKTGLFGTDTPGQSLWRDLSIDTAQATVTQNLSPTTIAQISLFGQVLKGFQSNPYRRVEVGVYIAQEAVPTIRARASVTVRFKKYIKALRAAIEFLARGYSDTWGVDSGTFGMTYSQYLGQPLLLRIRGRIYQQTEAVFFKDAGAYKTRETRAYFTGDRELSRVRDILFGAKLAYITEGKNDKPVWGIFDELRFNLKTDLIILEQLRADSMDANPFNVDDQFLNGRFAFVLQLGLLLKY